MGSDRLLSEAHVLAFIESDHEMSLNELRAGIAALPTAEPERADVRTLERVRNKLEEVALDGTPTTTTAAMQAEVRRMLTEARAQPAAPTTEDPCTAQQHDEKNRSASESDAASAGTGGSRSSSMTSRLSNSSQPKTSTTSSACTAGRGDTFAIREPAPRVDLGNGSLPDVPTASSATAVEYEELLADAEDKAACRIDSDAIMMRKLAAALRKVLVERNAAERLRRVEVAQRDAQWEKRKAAEARLREVEAVRDKLNSSLDTCCEELGIHVSWAMSGEVPNAVRALKAERDEALAKLREVEKRYDEAVTAPCDRCGHGKGADWKALERQRDEARAKLREVEAALQREREASRHQITEDAETNVKLGAIAQAAWVERDEARAALEESERALATVRSTLDEERRDVDRLGAALEAERKAHEETRELLAAERRSALQALEAEAHVRRGAEHVHASLDKMEDERDAARARLAALTAPILLDEAFADECGRVAWRHARWQVQDADFEHLDETTRDAWRTVGTEVARHVLQRMRALLVSEGARDAFAVAYEEQPTYTRETVRIHAGMRAALDHAGLHVAAEPSAQSDPRKVCWRNQEPCPYRCDGEASGRCKAPEPVADGRACPVHLGNAAQAALAMAVDAAEKWPTYNSAHEAFGVLLEEVDELKRHVWAKQSKRDLVAMRAECLDVAAVAIRFAAETCDEERGRR